MILLALLFSIKDAATRHNIITTHHLQTFLGVLCATYKSSFPVQTPSHANMMHGCHVVHDLKWWKQIRTEKENISLSSGYQMQITFGIFNVRKHNRQLSNCTTFRDITGIGLHHTNT